eukprot:3628899-Pleurochrysis_carterae.AAC.2
MLCWQTSAMRLELQMGHELWLSQYCSYPEDDVGRELIGAAGRAARNLASGRWRRHALQHCAKFR